ncbi:MAG TPA: type II CAAX endopeptidase family protein [Terriglobales bacterium]|nr:type II CAAX endopeptidase family protein [Terriglobales bacterium]
MTRGGVDENVKIVTMALKSKPFPAELTASRRFFIWAQIVIVFVLLELALWAPTTHLRNRWAAIAATALIVLVAADVLIDPSPRSSFARLGLGFPKASGAGVVLGLGGAALVLMVIPVRWIGGQIPANPAWFPNLPSVWGYTFWALMQEFILQSFFFNRFEELYGSEPAVWIASALFAAVHLPSPVLTTATLIGALFFCEMFRRYRSLYPIALVHAMLGLAIGLTVPDSLLHHMRVGIGYLRY